MEGTKLKDTSFQPKGSSAQIHILASVSRAPEQVVMLVLRNRLSGQNHLIKHTSIENVI